MIFQRFTDCVRWLVQWATETFPAEKAEITAIKDEAAAAKDLARDYAVSDTEITEGEYSAKYYSERAEESKENATQSAEQAAQSAQEAGISEANAANSAQTSEQWAQVAEDNAAPVKSVNTMTGEVVLSLDNFDLTQLTDPIGANTAAISLLDQLIKAMTGGVSYITAHDFGTATPTQEDLTAYALTQREELINSLAVVNLFDNGEWIYNLDGATWITSGNAITQTATNASLGVVKGSTEQGKASVNLAGEIELNLADWAKAEDKPSYTAEEVGAQGVVVYSTEETLTGDTWIDGKPIYRKALTGAVTWEANEAVAWHNTIPTDKIIKFSGWWATAGSGNNVISKLTVGQYEGGNYSCCTTRNTSPYNLITTFSKLQRTNSPFEMVIEYTKI